MLAYLFWHRPRAGVDPATYEDAQRSFQAAIEVPSACFRLAALPFASGGGYEDWYLATDWAAIGRLNEGAVDPLRRDSHDSVASLVAEGWGGVYALVRGRAEIPAGVEWIEKPRSEPSQRFVASLAHESVWRRQLVLGPAPEFCGAAAPSGARARI